MIDAAVMATLIVALAVAIISLVGAAVLVLEQIASPHGAVVFVLALVVAWGTIFVYRWRSRS